MSELRIVRGNSFRTRIKVHALNPDMTEMSDFSLLDCTNLELFVLRAYKAVRIRSWEIHSDDEIDITWDAPFCMNLGIYGLEIRGRLDGVAWRFANRDLFTIVETTQEGNIPEGSFIADGDYEMEADFVLVLRVGAVQSDWAVDDQSDPAYIKHKPDLDLYAQKTWIQQQGYITSETDPTVPAWAKQPHKPTYTAQEVGALPDTTVIPTALSQLSQDSTHRVVTDAQLSQIEFDHNKLDGTILDVIDIKAKIPSAADIANWNGKADKVPVVNHGTSSTTLAIAPNTFHVWGTVGSLNITLTAPTESGVVNLYSFQFTSGSTPTNLTLPSGVQWPKDNALTVEANMAYEVNIRDNKATWSGWEVV